MPAISAELACVRTDARPLLDVRRYDWAPDDGWVPKVTETIIRTWAPVFAAELGWTRTRERPGDPAGLLQTVPDDGWVPKRVDTVVSTWTGVFQAELGSYRSADRVTDRTYLQQTLPDDGWIVAALPPTVTTAQLWPAILANLPLSYRSPTRTGLLDLPSGLWAPDDGWVPLAVDAVVAKWASIFTAELGNRTDARLALDVRRVDDPRFSWVAPVVDVTVAAWGPVFASALRSVRSDDRGRLDVRLATWDPGGWIFTNLPSAVTQAQLWPAILQALGLSYRSVARPLLDVRGAEWNPTFGWVNPVVDGIVSRWSPVFGAELAGVRIGSGPALDSRWHDWVHEPAWIVANFGAITTAQIWPAILQAMAPSYRSVERPRLDVRAYEWNPTFGWIPGAVDAALAKWAPIWAAELNSTRSPDRAKLDVRGHEWSPEFGWAQRVVDATVRQWAPIFAAEVGYRSAARARLDVRDGTWSPELAWLVAVLTSPPSLPPFVRASDEAVGHTRTLRTRFTITSDLYEAPQITPVEGLRVGDLLVLNVPAVVTPSWSLTYNAAAFAFIGPGTVANPADGVWLFRVLQSVADTFLTFTARTATTPQRVFTRLVAGYGERSMLGNRVRAAVPRRRVTRIA